ncbi:PIN domain-containing protein [Wenzhouxiangella sp. EGI_FJ10409]|uniref:PIN domain-containing protein n=1 Tax=Wenzhouxiangella sp. EGI_FJ10409 TaxID=3243767 RepID=UPI0035E0EFF4
MTATYFVDTNVFVYARDCSEPAKHSRAREWVEHLWTTGTGRLSTQVIKEYYQVVTRRLDPGLPREEARADIRDMLTWRPVDVSAQVLEQAWSIEDRYGFSWWDSMIVAAACHLRCDYLLSEDLQSGQEVDGVVVVDPFLTAVNE